MINPSPIFFHAIHIHVYSFQVSKKKICLTVILNVTRGWYTYESSGLFEHVMPHFDQRGFGSFCFIGFS